MRRPDLGGPEVKRGAFVRAWQERWARYREGLERTDQRRLAGVVVGLAALMIVALFVPTTTPDTQRFELQADAILAGSGFRTGPVLETFLPPGYPLFLAAIRVFTVERLAALAVHCALALCAVLAVYSSLRPFGSMRAVAGALFLAANPWVARQASYALSETLGLFLCALIVWLTLRIVRGWSGPAPSLALGALLVVLPLTSPATLVFAGLLGLALIVRVRRWEFVLPLAFGALVPWSLWQAHCLAAGSGIQWTMTRASDLGSKSGYSRWMNTWLIRQRDLHWWHNPKDLESAPVRAFASQAERAALVRMARESGRPGWSEAEDAVFARIAARNRRDRPIYTMLGIVLVRTLVLWLDMPQLGHLQMEYVGRILPAEFSSDRRTVGISRAVQRFGKALGSTIAWIAWVAPAVAFVILGGRALGKKDLLGSTVVVGLLAYSFVSGAHGLGESRRNLVFFPAAALLLRGEKCRTWTARRAKTEPPQRQDAIGGNAQLRGAAPTARDGPDESEPGWRGRAVSGDRQAQAELERPRRATGGDA